MKIVIKNVRIFRFFIFILFDQAPAVAQTPALVNLPPPVTKLEVLCRSESKALIAQSIDSMKQLIRDDLFNKKQCRLVAPEPSLQFSPNRKISVAELLVDPAKVTTIAWGDIRRAPRYLYGYLRFCLTEDGKNIERAVQQLGRSSFW